VPTKMENGRIPLKDGLAITWTRRELAPREARAFTLEARLRTYRVTTVAERRDGCAVVGTYNVPGTHLHAFLVGDMYDYEGGPGKGHAVWTVEALPVSGEVANGPAGQRT
jgi:hypothetical protein